MTLRTAICDDTVTVEDTDGGRWWPNEDAESQINAAADPEAEAICICENEPMRGEWRQ